MRAGKWSPDGRQLVFTKGEGKDVYLAKADGTDARKLFTVADGFTPLSLMVQFLQFSPDSTRIRFYVCMAKSIQIPFGRSERMALIFIPCCRAGGIRLLNAAGYGRPTDVIFSS